MFDQPGNLSTLLFMFFMNTYIYLITYMYYLNRAGLCNSWQIKMFVSFRLNTNTQEKKSQE